MIRNFVSWEQVITDRTHCHGFNYEIYPQQNCLHICLRMKLGVTEVPRSLYGHCLSRCCLKNIHSGCDLAYSSMDSYWLN